MRYAKINENGTLTFAPRCVIYDNKQLFNPPADVLAILGYKSMSDIPYPEQEDGQDECYYVNRYEERESEIVQIWEETAPPASTVDVRQLKAQLAQSDYKIIKCAEYQLASLPLPYEIAQIHAERQAIRDQINEVEA